MKIVYIAPSTIPSETANSVQVMKVCQALTQLGHDVRLIVPGHPFADRSALQRHYGLTADFEISWLSFSPMLRKLDFAWKAVRTAKALQADVIYTRVLWVALLAQVRRLPVILEVHEVPSGRMGPFLYRRYVLSKGKKLTVFITAALKRIIEEEMHLRHPDSENMIAPDGVDLERYQDLPRAGEARKALRQPEGFTALYSGGFYPGRGLEILLDLALKFPDVHFLCVGGKPDLVSHWQNRVVETGLKNFTLTGFVANEKLPLYQACADVLLMPYRRHVAGSGGGDISNVTSPMKAFEYMACGRAILCSDLPVLHEIFNENNAAFYPPEDLEGLANKFSLLKNDDRYRESLGSQAKSDVVKYSWKARMSAVLSNFEGHR